MPLTFAESGKTYTIQKINGKDEAKKHLNHLGLLEQENVLVHQCSGGSVIVEVKGVRLALDAKTARRIMI